MGKSLFIRRGGEGVASWLKLVAFIGAVALMLSTLTLVPSQARADENSENAVATEIFEDIDLTDATQSEDAADLVDLVIPELEITETPDIPVEFEEDLPTAESILQDLEALNLPDARGDPNPFIEVEVDSIKSDDDEGVSVGDTVLVEGTWDASLTEDSLGTVFWVTFPTGVLDGLRVEDPLLGTSLLRADDGSAIGFQVDTAEAGKSGVWTVEAKASAATEDTVLNFRTSANPDKDIPVDLPGDAGIKDPKTRAARVGSGTDGPVTVSGIVIENVPNPGEKLMPGELAKISGKWSANEGAKEGDTFTVQIPDVFTLAPIDDFPLVGGDSDYGTCRVNASARLLTCTLNDLVEVEEDVHGEWNLWVTASKVTADRNVEFIIDGGDPVEVALPGDAGGIGVITPMPANPRKSGVKNGQQGATWTVDLPGAYLAENGIEVPATFKDTPTSQNVVAGSGTLKYYDEVNTNGSPKELKDLEGGSIVLGEMADGSFDITVHPGADEWDPAKVYRITYRTETDGLLPPTSGLGNSFGIGDGPGIGGNTLYPTWKTGRNVDNTWQAIEWSILAPAKEAVGGNLVITDTFDPSGIPHFADQATIDSLQVTGAAIDGNAALVVDSTNNKKITITIPVSDEVKNSNAVYTVKYKTFYEGTDTHPKGSLPEGGKKFQNHAKVGSVEVKAEVTTPSWNSGKSGYLNAQPVEIGGVTHPINTALKWTINASGNKLADLQAPVKITDTLNKDHQICDVPGTLEQKLNLKFTVVDRTTNRDVTDSAGVNIAVSSDGPQNISYTLTTESGEFSRDHIYRIEYNTCTSSGGQDPVGTTYSNAVNGSGVQANGSVQLRAGGGGTGTGVSRGSFALQKGWQNGSAIYPSDLEFKVKAEEYKPGATPGVDKPDSSYEITVKSDGQPVSGHFTRGDGWTIRLKEVGFPQLDGLAFGTPKFVAGPGVAVSADGTIADVTINKKNNATVQLNNIAKKGEVKLIKKVVGEARDKVAADTVFKVEASIEGGETKTYNLAADQEVTIRDLPVGKKVTFQEILPANTDDVTWAAPVFEPGQTITVGQSATVTVKNEAKHTKGTFSVQKKVTGDQAQNPKLPETFKVLATWQEGGREKSGTLVVPTNGNPVTYEGKIPAGTQVTLSEILPPNGDGMAWGEPNFTGNGVTLNAEGNPVFTVGLDPVAVLIKNYANDHVGDVLIKKQVVGGAKDAATGAEFKITAKYGNQQRDYTLKDGGQWLLEDLKIGTEVTFSEALPADSDAVTWGAPEFSPGSTVIVSSDTDVVEVLLKNDAQPTEGTFSLKKKVTGDQAENPNVPESFTVIATWGDNEKTELVVPTNGDPVTYAGKIPAGTTVTLSEILPPNGGGISWGAPRFLGDGVSVNENGEAEFLVGLDPVNVTIKNDAKDHLGDVLIKKQVVGDAKDAAEGAKFRITAKIGDSEEKLYTLADGEYWLIKDLPIGTEVTFTETLPANSDDVTWGKPEFTPSETVTVNDDVQATEVVLKNEANITEGTFSLKKKVTGPEEYNPNVPQIFTVEATWDVDGTPGEYTFELPADGTKVDFPHKLPAGTKVTLTENVPADGNGLAWATPAFSGEHVVGENGQGVVTIGLQPRDVKVKNHVDKNDGTMRLTKAVAGEAAEAVGDDAEFTVEARWKDGDRYETRNLTVKQNESVELGADLPFGTEVTFKETGRPDVAGVEWGSITWGTNPSGEQWLTAHADGTATGIISDDPTEGRLITLSNEALWKPGAVEFEKYILDENGDSVRATEAELPAGAEFKVQITAIDPPLAGDVDFPAVGETITLNAANDYKWTSRKVLPKDTTVTFSELDPAALRGMDWGQPVYWVENDAEEDGQRDHVTIVEDGQARVHIKNRPIPTTEVDIDKIVTGPKGTDVENNLHSRFQVTASWTDIDGSKRHCVLDVVPGLPATPTSDCNATVIDGEVQFPLNTEITFVETGATTGIPNVTWGDVHWSVAEGKAKLSKLKGKGKETGTIVTLTGKAGQPVTLGLENETSSNGLILIPLPIPLPPFGGGSSVPPTPSGPTGPSTPTSPTSPVQPGQPTEPAQPGQPGTPGHPGKLDPSMAKGANSKSGLAMTGANVAWLAGGGLLLLIGGAWLVMRGRKNEA